MFTNKSVFMLEYNKNIKIYELNSTKFHIFRTHTFFLVISKIHIENIGEYFRLSILIEKNCKNKPVFKFTHYVSKIYLYLILI